MCQNMLFKESHFKHLFLLRAHYEVAVMSGNYRPRQLHISLQFRDVDFLFLPKKIPVTFSSGNDLDIKMQKELKSSITN